MEEVSPPLANTRRVTFAIWWNLCAVTGVCGFIAGFLAYTLPRGQLEFWLLASVAKVLGPVVAEYLHTVPGALQAAIDIAIDFIGVAFLFLAMNWLLAWHVGRRIGKYRLVLQRVQ
jgi:hypothetical protein